MPVILDCGVLRNDEVGDGIFLTRFHAPAIVNQCSPGQFVNIRTKDGFPPLLRRPFSICRICREEGWFEILYKVVGPGTILLANLRPGETRSIIGPLGKGFRVPSENRQAILVAGGIGVAPFPFLAEVLYATGIEHVVLLGARTARDLWGVETFDKHARQVHVCTDDGSLGFRGTVVERLRRLLHEAGPAIDRFQVYGCGPEPMLQAMLDLGRATGVSMQISVETMMGCGFGICMGCPMPRPKGEPAGPYKLACMDGPVFDISEVEIQWQS